MSARLVFGFAVALVMSCCGFSQQTQTAVRVGDRSPGAHEQEFLRRIATAEATVRQAESAHASDVALGRAYWSLGLAYEPVEQWGRADAALTHSVFLFRHARDDGKELATALDSLAVLHVSMGKLRESEKEEREAVGLCEKLGDRLQLARSWNTLAALSLKQHKYEKAREFAGKAQVEFASNAQADESDLIASRYALGMALCALKDCASAVPILKEALNDARMKLSANDFPISMGQFLLGYAYWKSGDMASGGREMQAGVIGMNKELGSPHPSYVAVLGLYGKYLREAGNVEAANDVESQIRQAEAVVDVRTLQSGQAALGFDGLR